MASTSDKNVRPKRRWLRFSMRGLMVLVTILCGVLALLRHDYFAYRNERHIWDQIDAAGGFSMGNATGVSILNEEQFGENHLSIRQRWVASLVGDHFYHRINFVGLYDQDLKEVAALLPQLPELQAVGISDTTLTSEVSDSLAQIEKLEELSISDTKIVPENFHRLAACKHLRDISLWGESATDEVLSRMTKFRSLTELSITRAPITEAGLRSAVRFPALKHLHLRLIQDITPDALSCLADCPNLEILLLDCMPINDQTLKELSRLPSLRVLLIEGHETDVTITAKGLSYLTELQTLEHLSLWFRPLEDEEVRTISQLSNLQHFSCDGQKLTSKSIDYLEQLESLKSLTIQEAPIGIPELRRLAALPQLTELKLGGNLELTLPEHVGYWRAPPSLSRQDIFQGKRGALLPITTAVETSPEPPPKPLPPIFANVYDDPFIPADAKEKSTAVTKSP